MITSQTVICIKWGTRYGADYVNRLWSMIKRNTNRDTKLICFTDDATNINQEVQIEPLPEINLPEWVRWVPWRKISLWRDDLACLSGDVVFVDLDVVITGNIDDFFDFEPGRFCVIENFTQRGKNIGNTTFYKFPVGRYSHIFNKLNENPDAILEKYRIEQQYISNEIDDMVFWPKEWCVSFKHDLLPKWPLNFFKTPSLPQTTKLVAFTGKPDPDEAAIGQWPVKSPWKKLYKHVRPTPWIMENWR